MPADEDAGGADDGDYGTGGTGGEPPGGTGGEEPGDACADAQREPDDPRVLFDADVACTHTMFARYGVAAAAAADAVYVATAGFDASWVFRVDAQDVDPIASAPYLVQQRALASMDAAGGLLVAGVVDGDPQQLSISRWDGSWFAEVVEIDGGVEWLVDLAGAADGRALAWLYSGAERWVSAAQTDGSSTVVDAGVPDGAVNPRFTTALDGRELAASHMPIDGERWRLAVRQGDEPTVHLGDALTDAPTACIPVRDSAIGMPDSAAPFVVLSARDDALVLDSPAQPNASLPMPDSARMQSACPVPEEGQACLPSCHDVASGRLDDAIAAARTADGTVWVAWVHADIDRTVGYVEACDDTKGSCWCDAEITDDASRYALRLAAVRADGTSETALVVPLADDPCGDQVLGPGDALDLHAHGDRLAIVVRTAESDVLPGAAFTLRTLLVDASPDPRAEAAPGATD
jgi:hypothetical protein